MEIPNQATPGGKRPPVTAMWVVMIAGWIALVAPVAFTVFLGLPLAIVALVLACLCLGRGRKLQGILGMVGSTLGSMIAYAIGLALFAVMLAGEVREEYVKSAAEAAVAVAAAQEPPEVDAATLLADFAANHNAALERYDGVFDVSGVVTATGKDVMDSPYISIAAEAGGKPAVDCLFTTDKSIDLSGIAVGDEVTVRGKVGWFIEVRMMAARLVE